MKKHKSVVIGILDYDYYKGEELQFAVILTRFRLLYFKRWALFSVATDHDPLMGQREVYWNVLYFINWIKITKI